MCSSSVPHTPGYYRKKSPRGGPNMLVKGLMDIMRPKNLLTHNRLVAFWLTLLVLLSTHTCLLYKGTLIYVIKIVITPVELNGHLTPLPRKPLSNPSLYRWLVSNLFYLIVSHLDISYVVYQVSQFLSASQATHYAVVLCILRYLKNTFFYSLYYST